MTDAIIPETYEQWHHCITVLCQQPLTPDYIDSRIKALNDPQGYMTRKFIELYGDQQRMQTLQWLEKAKSSVHS